MMKTLLKVTTLLNSKLDYLFGIRSFQHYPEWTQIASVAAPAKAGSAVVHNGLTAHGAGANMTSGPRRAMTCAYLPDGSTFNGKRNILPTELFESLQVGDPLDSDWNPLIWSKTAATTQK